MLPQFSRMHKALEKELYAAIFYFVVYGALFVEGRPISATEHGEVLWQPQEITWWDSLE